ncbi:MAG: hypothetical protein AUJ92_20345 [Armatimonadetes bacterium CG2_30_59_28]|nr:MAG: hypothetical protein AUJ92_20345 [Armatimonadetes bacterium CG2_30_59_28]PIU60844.1 MAG: hypothetical protein COS85_22450 [Armatimonadetes bacterium CG07_land_8_20_14_0_80_59_28]
MTASYCVIKNGEIYYLGATIITTDPKLGTLGNYGGYTQTIPILAGSSAIDAADDSVAPTTDQRGVSRPQGAHADIGAFESQGFTLAVAGGNGQSAAINTAFTNPLSVSLTANGAGEPVDGGSVTFTAPTTGASASLATSPATISNGAASVTATANGTSGSYQVTASAAGANSVNFALTNTLPEMDVEGNATPIADGDATPSTTDDTDFGSADIATGEADHTFTIKNTGNGDLNLTSDPKVKITGANAGDFTVAEQPASPVPGGSSVTFTVRFDPSATGIRTATISIANNDSNENPYDFAVRGTGTTRAPDIEVLGNGRSIANGAAAPDQGHHTDFGPVNIRTGSVEHTFTIQNNGTAEDLLLTGDPKVVISGDNAADFSITLQPSSPVSSAGTTTFQVKFDPGATGVRTATVSIASNDSDENPFEFTIQGTGTATPSNVVQIDVSSIFNKDVIANNGGTDRTLTAWDINGDATHDYVASGVAASWMTQSVANVHTGAPASQSDRNALPDYGLFPANADHPDVQLAYRNSDDGLNAYGSNAGDTTFSFTVPTGRYQKLQIFAASTYGSSTLSATFTYVGNSTQVQSDIKIEDWFQAPPPGGFTLIGSRDVLWYINGHYAYYNSNGPDIFGANLTPDNSKELKSVEMKKTAGGTSELTFYGATGVLPAAPEMDVQGNGVSITDGDTTPAVDDHTDFGAADIGAGTVERTFTIRNTGSADLNLTGDPKVTITGDHAADFSVTEQPTSPVASEGGTTTFQVTFDPTATGTRTATINIANDDSDENPYEFAVQGTGTISGDIYVDQNCPGATHDGTSWEKAYLDLAPVLEIVVSPSTIYVARGSYTPTTDTDRTRTFQLESGVTLSGGYPTGGGTRDPGTYVTTLSGDVGVAANNSDNSYHVVTGSGTDSTAVLDGFTITAGNADGTSPHNAGGGMYNNGGSPTLTNLAFSNNSAGAGGGIYSSDASPTLTNVTFSENSAPGTGSGGGMYNSNGSPTLTNVTFSRNSAGYVGGGMYNVSSSSPTLTNCTFSGNSAIAAAGIGCGTGTTPTVRNTILWGDSSGEIGGGGTPTVTYCVVQGDPVYPGTGNTNANPNLGILGNYGGYTQTIPIEDEGSAIDAADDSVAPKTDQRGVSRPQGAHADIGAYESVVAPEIDVQGNNALIADGDTTPAAEDHTDFGSADISTGTVERTFTIKNTGSAVLNLTGDPNVTIGGDHAGDFSVTEQPSSPVTSGGGATTFKVKFNPAATGTRTATISIANDDSNENPYDFTVQGTGTAAAEMDVLGNGVSIADGDTTPAAEDHTDFGSADISTGTAERTFTIKNIGSAVLNLTGDPKVTIGGDHAGDFSVTEQPSSPVTSDGGTTTFKVKFNPVSAGTRRATISIANDDSDENPYNFAVQGLETMTHGDIHVDQNCQGATHDGSTWATAYLDLAPVLSGAQSGDTIHVAKGTYRPTAGGDGAATFQLKNGVTLLGGYATGGGTRDGATNATTLSGDLGIQQDNSDNSYHVVTGSGTDATAVLDGFTITAGNANASSQGINGGGLLNNGGSPTLKNLTFSGNSAWLGGGMFSSGNATLTNVTFSGNEAGFGGGLYTESSLTLTNVTFTGNSAPGRDGGGMFDANGGSTLTHVTFSGNSAGRGGGFASYVTAPTIRNSILWGNTANQGAQIYAIFSNIVVSDCVVQDGYWLGTNIITADPKLGTLGNYGGHTQTIPVQEGSSAINAANATYAPATDQRGYDRSGAPDIGAYEYGGAPSWGVPEIDVLGNAVSIADGDTTPATDDHTDFGAADISTGTVERTFTIRNTGSADLNLTGDPKVAISGDHAADFSVTEQPSSPVTNGGGTTTFKVKFDPSASGARTATISIANNDADENPYNFAIQGTGTAVRTVSFTSASQASTQESGTLTITAELSAASDKDVTVPFTLSGTATKDTDYSITATPITLVAGQTSANITITIAADTVDESDETVVVTMGDPTNATKGATTVHTATITDDDTAGITVAPTSGLTTTEAGGAATFTVKLNSQPTSDVTIGLSISDTTEGAVSPSSLTFTTANWSTAQTVTVTGVDDWVDDGDIGYTVVTAAATSADANYNGANAADVSATNTDNDGAGITVNPTSGLTTTEAGGTATFTVKLNSQPTGDVTIALSRSDATEGAASPASLTFTAANWSTAQTVTVTGVDDNLDDGDIAYTIATAAATSADAKYNGLNAADVSATNTDNDAASVSFAAAAQSSVQESGTMTVTAQLSVASTLNVTVPFALSGTATQDADYTIPNSPITIPAGATTAAATIAIKEDTDDEPDETVVLTMGNPTNASKGAITEHTATITDDDTTQPDLLIKRDGDPDADFALDDEYQLVPEGEQIVGQIGMKPGEKKDYQVKVENDGNGDRVYLLWAEESSEYGWTVTYLLGTTDITDQILNEGYLTSDLAPGASETITLEMTPESGLPAGASKTVTVMAFLEDFDFLWQDAVEAVTIYSRGVRPDAMIKQTSQPDSAYSTDNEYYAYAKGEQIEQQTIDPRETASYRVKIQNDGLIPVSFVVKMEESEEPGWSVECRAGFWPITEQVFSAEGYTTALLSSGDSEVLTLKIRPGDSLVCGSEKSAWLYVFLDGDDTMVRDCVLAETTVLPAPAPTVTRIMPYGGLNNGPVAITNLSGSNFRPGDEVKLVKEGETDIGAANVTIVTSSKITCTFDLTGKPAGAWDVVVTDDCSQSGALAGGFTIVEASTVTHDVAVTALTAAPNPVFRGRTVTFSYTVENLGNVPEKQLTVRLTYSGRTLAPPQTIPVLNPGQQHNGEFKLKIQASAPPGEYLFTVEVLPVIGETDSGNNSQTVKVTVR